MYIKAFVVLLASLGSDKNHTALKLVSFCTYKFRIRIRIIIINNLIILGFDQKSLFD